LIVFCIIYTNDARSIKYHISTYFNLGMRWSWLAASGCGCFSLGIEVPSSFLNTNLYPRGNIDVVVSEPPIRHSYCT